MKKGFIVAGLLIIAMLITGATGRRYIGDKSYTTTVYRATYSGPQTQFEAVSATTGVSYVIDKIIFSPGIGRDFFYIEDSGGIVYGPIRVNAFEPYVDNEVLLKLASESAILVTTEVSGDLTINYHNE